MAIKRRFPVNLIVLKTNLAPLTRVKLLNALRPSNQRVVRKVLYFPRRIKSSRTHVNV